VDLLIVAKAAGPCMRESTEVGLCELNTSRHAFTVAVDVTICDIGQEDERYAQKLDCMRRSASLLVRCTRPHVLVPFVVNMAGMTYGKSLTAIIDAHLLSKERATKVFWDTYRATVGTISAARKAFVIGATAEQGLAG